MFVRRKIVPLIFKDSFYSRLEIPKSVAKPVRDAYSGFCHSNTLTCLTHAHTFVATKEGNTSIHKQCCH